MSNRTKRSIAVIGLGAFGSTVASGLAEFGNVVLGVDRDEQAVGNLAETLHEAVIADARDEDALREAGVGEVDLAVIAIGKNLEASIVSTLNTQRLGVPCIWVEAGSQTHRRILIKLGADRVILPEHEIGQHIAEMAHNPLIRHSVDLGNGFFVADLEVPPELEGRSLDETELFERFELRCLGLMRGTNYLGDGGDETRMETDDMLLLLGRREHLRAFGDSL